MSRKIQARSCYSLPSHFPFLLPAGKFYKNATKYSQPNSGQKEFAGWSRKGLKRFQKIGAAIKLIRKKRSSVEHEKYILKKLRTEAGKDKAQKKKRKVPLVVAPKLDPVLTTDWDDDELCFDNDNDEDEVYAVDEDDEDDEEDDDENSDNSDDQSQSRDGDSDQSQSRHGDSDHHRSPETSSHSQEASSHRRETSEQSQSRNQQSMESNDNDNQSHNNDNQKQ